MYKVSYDAYVVTKSFNVISKCPRCTYLKSNYIFKPFIAFINVKDMYSCIKYLSMYSLKICIVYTRKEPTLKHKT